MNKTPQQILADVQAAIASLEKQKLTPLLGFALSNLRGAEGAIIGHLDAIPATTTAPATATAQEPAADPAEK